nr:hypothetical protein KPHV_63220 [Kitasatospora purpeofusca]
MAQEIEKSEKVGSVSASRYEELVALLREVVENQTRGQFTIGEAALEIEPMRDSGGQAPAKELFSVKVSLVRLAEDIGLSYSTVKDARWTASRWPAERRQPKVSFTVHRTLAGIGDERERFAAILTPPPEKGRWTADWAKRRVGRQVEVPITPQEKVSAIHHVVPPSAARSTVRQRGVQAQTAASPPNCRSPRWWWSPGCLAPPPGGPGRTTGSPGTGHRTVPERLGSREGRVRVVCQVTARLGPEAGRILSRSRGARPTSALVRPVRAPAPAVASELFWVAIAALMRKERSVPA